jgi:hypothetical protein
MAHCHRRPNRGRTVTLSPIDTARANGLKPALAVESHRQQRPLIGMRDDMHRLRFGVAGNRADEPAARRPGPDGGQVPRRRIARRDRRAIRAPGRAGVQHVITRFAETNETDLIELLGSSVLPQRRDIEAADPRTLAANVPEAVTR